jgi:hypothetical protein
MPWINEPLREALADIANGRTPARLAALERALRQTEELALCIAGVDASVAGRIQADGGMQCETTDHPQAGRCVLAYVDRQAASSSAREGFRPAAIATAELATMMSRLAAPMMLLNPEGTHPDGPDWCILTAEQLRAILAPTSPGVFQRLLGAAVARVFGRKN